MYPDRDERYAANNHSVVYTRSTDGYETDEFYGVRRRDSWDFLRSRVVGACRFCRAAAMITSMRVLVVGDAAGRGAVSLLVPPLNQCVGRRGCWRGRR